MRNKSGKFAAILLSSFVALSITFNVHATEPSKVSTPVITKTQTSKTEVPAVYKEVSAVELVNNPQTYINSQVKIVGRFDKFSNLGLDYPPVRKDSKDYISFIIKRPDVPVEYNIPLSELKFFMKREKAEKYAELESGDQIEVMGTVFSAALGDAWVEVDNIKVVSAKNKKFFENLNKPAEPSAKKPAAKSNKK